MKADKKRKKKKRGAGDILLIVIMLVAVGVFCYAGYQLLQIFREYNEGTKEYEGLRDFVQIYDAAEEPVKQENGESAVVDANEIPSCPVQVDFNSLKSLNSDVIGWIYIEAIPEISYPIVKGTDNDFYLKHTVEKVRNSSASIFVDYRNESDFSDSNTVVYGHNMKNLSMFGRLSSLLNEDVYSKSSYIWISTPEEDICYEIFSVRHVSEMDELYISFNVAPEEFANDLNAYQKLSEVPYVMSFDGTEKIITLSTCTSNDTVRCIVQAVRKDF